MSIYQVRACPVCGGHPGFDPYKNYMEHICTNPRFSWSMNAGMSLGYERWEVRCDNVARILEEEGNT